MRSLNFSPYATVNAYGLNFLRNIYKIYKTADKFPIFKYNYHRAGGDYEIVIYNSFRQFLNALKKLPPITLISWTVIELKDFPYTAKVPDENGILIAGVY